MSKNRVEAFSDGVMAIIVTIMVLELKVPHSEEASALISLAPVFLSYILSFIYIVIYWNNHHHLFQIVKYVNGPILWANAHLLFWLSLIPFATAWSGENHFAKFPIALYGFILLMAGFSYFILAKLLTDFHGKGSSLAKALGHDSKGKISVVLYALAIPLAFWSSWVAFLIYIGVAIMWIVPDRRVEKLVVDE